jgi:hypothetical protein
MRTTYALLAGLTAHAAAWDYNAQPYSSPQYANNECSDQQKRGFEWAGLKDSDSNFQYGEFDFSVGWKCSTSTFKRKAITNVCSKTKPVSFSSETKQYGFSISTLDITSDYDTEVDLHYTLIDGSVCKQNAVPCKQAGSTIKNS